MQITEFGRQRVKTEDFKKSLAHMAHDLPLDALVVFTALSLTSDKMSDGVPHVFVEDEGGQAVADFINENKELIGQIIEGVALSGISCGCFVEEGYSGGKAGGAR